MSNELSVVEATSTLEDLLDDDGFLPEENPNPQEEEEVIEDEESNEEEQEVEDEESDAEEEAEDEPKDKPEDESEDTLYEIEIDGELYEVNEEELVSGYLRNEQLVKRQQEVEEQYQAKQNELEQTQQQLLDRLEELTLEGNVALQKFRNVNWERLRNENPEAYKEARLDYIEAQEIAQKRESQRQQLLAMHQQAQTIKHEAYLKAQRSLAEKLIPEINDQEVVQKIVDYGKGIGFSEQEIQSIADAKILFLLNQSRLYSESQLKRKEAKETKVSKDLPPVIKPGAPRSVAQENGRKERDLKAQLRNTTSLRDAAKLLEHFV